MQRALSWIACSSLGLMVAGNSGAVAPLATDAAQNLACDAATHQTVLHPAPANTNFAATAVWLDATTLRWPGVSGDGQFRLYFSADAQIHRDKTGAIRGAEGALELEVTREPLSPELATRFAWIDDGVVLRLRASDRARMPTLLRTQLVITSESPQGQVLAVASTQVAGALDALYADATEALSLDPAVSAKATVLRLWAPTAQNVTLCLHDGARTPVRDVVAMTRLDASGVWQARLVGDHRGKSYRYLVDVVVPDVGVVRNRVTDPYAISLTADSQRAWLGNLDDASLKPEGWRGPLSDRRARSPLDQVIYELHVRDFSIGDDSVAAARRGKYLAFTTPDSQGMRHLRALAEAGVSDVHLLPVFDFATVPEQGCVTPAIAGHGDSIDPQASVTASKATDCFNWGYDPLHFGAPEGSYASNADDGAVRIREFRAMVQALHDAGLRVGMDVVYNHMSASGQDAKSVLDRIVPGYYHRLDKTGTVTTSTCCANTATEQRMMAKLMIDTAVRWVRHYGIDAFRFDLMGHQPRAAMERLRAAVDAASGRRIDLLGEGWNFGEVANGARFVQASQLELNGRGIATFSDRARDAVRGGGPGDNDARLVTAQGFVNGLHYDRNAQAHGTREELLRAADMVRVGLAGSLRDYMLHDHRDQRVTLAQIGYGGGQPAGYVSAPDEVVNYVENHDNQTLFDINVFKLPTGTSREDRARVQMLAVAINLFSQGIAYFHAGVDTLRSKSLDRNSYDSGDWFNRIDWTFKDNHFATGLPPQQDNGQTWDLMRPLLTDARIKPEPEQIAWMRDAFRDLLRIRSSSTLFRLRMADDVRARLRFANTGSAQEPTVIAGLLDGRGYAGARFASLAYFVNVDTREHVLTVAEALDVDYVLHPIHRDVKATDRRPIESAHFERSKGRFTIPPRSAVVFVVE